MATNRYTQLSYSDPNQMPMLSLPYEAMDQVLGQYQQRQDQFTTLSNLGFQFLQDSDTDVELAGQVQGYQDSVREEIAKAAQTGKVSDYQRALRGGLGSLMKLRTPGGPVAALEGRVQQMAAAKKKINKQFKDEIGTSNHSYAMAMLKPGDIGYNLDSGTYNQISAPNVQNYFNVKELMLDTAKTMHPEITEISRIQGDYIWDEKGTKYHVGDVLQGIWNSPEVQEQLRIETWDKMRKMNPAQKQQLVGSATAAAAQQKATLISQMASLEAKLNSGNRKKVREAQNILKELGVNPGALDGKLGPKTKAAYETAMADVQKGMDEMRMFYGEEDVPDLVLHQLKESYGLYMAGLVPDSYSHKINQANWRAKANQAKMDMMTMMSLFAADADSDIVPGYGTSRNVDMPKLEGEMADVYARNNELATEVLNDLKTDGVFDPTESLNSATQKAIYLQELSKEHGDNLQAINEAYAKKYNLTKELAEAQVRVLKNDGGNLTTALKTRANTGNVLNGIKLQDAENRRIYSLRDGEEKIRAIYDKAQKIAENQKKAGAATVTMTVNPTNIYDENPETIGVDVAGKMAGYDYKRFKEEYLKTGEVPVLGETGVGKTFTREYQQGQATDLQSNRDAYASTIAYSLHADKDDYPAMNKAEELLADMEMQGEFINTTDNTGLLAPWMSSAGEEVPEDNIDYKQRPGVSFIHDAFGNGVKFTRPLKSGGVAEKVISLEDARQDPYLNDQLLKVTAQALNNRNMSDVTLIMPFLVDRTAQEKFIISETTPERDKVRGDIYWLDDEGNRQYKYRNSHYSVADSYIKANGTELLAITSRTPEGFQEYYTGVKDAEGNIMLVPDLNGEKGYNLKNISNATDILDLNELYDNPQLQTYQQEYNQRPIYNIAPENRGGAFQILSNQYKLNLNE